MAKIVFTTKINPTYDDLPEYRYHFPGTYLNDARSAIGDSVIYYEPRRSSGDLSSRGGRQSYFAVAHLDAIEPDASRADHYYARVSGYIDFPNPVPFREAGHYYESGLRRADGGTNKGRFGRSVRPISDTDFDAILARGFARLLCPENNVSRTSAEWAEEPEEFVRPIVQRLVSRPFREAAFSSSVKNAYENTCAITSLKIINGGGRSEAQAAHIRPVADSGTDSIRNGLALSGTVHWMFDRGLISVGDDYSILVAKGRVPDTIRRVFNESGQIRLPKALELRPALQFLRYHRENKFKG
jgi:putative restriction endonuclease